MNVKIFVNQDYVNGPYGGGNAIIKALLESKNNDVTFTNKFVDLAKGIDAFFVTNLNGHNGQLNIIQIFDIARSYDKKVFLRVNENDARKGTSYVDKNFADVMMKCDHVFFVSHWLKKYYEDRFDLTNIKSSVIYNGVDYDIFCPCHESDKFKNDGKIHIVTHHWSDHKLKGVDIYEKIDEFVEKNQEFTFTYIGRKNKDSELRNSLHINPLFGGSLGHLLSKFDVYISGSRNDPGPNHVSESIACGLPTYVHEQGGGAVEFAGSDHVYCDWKDLKKLLLSRTFSYNNTSFKTWEESIIQYITTICDNK